MAELSEGEEGQLTTLILTFVPEFFSLKSDSGLCGLRYKPEILAGSVKDAHVHSGILLSDFTHFAAFGMGLIPTQHCAIRAVRAPSPPCCGVSASCLRCPHPLPTLRVPLRFFFLLLRLWVFCYL